MYLYCFQITTRSDISVCDVCLCDTCVSDVGVSDIVESDLGVYGCYAVVRDECLGHPCTGHVRCWTLTRRLFPHGMQPRNQVTFERQCGSCSWRHAEGNSRTHTRLKNCTHGVVKCILGTNTCHKYVRCCLVYVSACAFM